MKKSAIARASLGSSLVFLVLSCATVSHLVTQDNLQLIKRGMSQEEFKTGIPRAPKSVFAVTLDDVSYPVEIYDMQTGTRTQTSSSWVPMYPSGGYMATSTYTVPVTEDYVFIFDESGLFSWGFVNELEKDDDTLVQDLAPLIVAEYENQQRIEKEKYEKAMKKQKAPYGG